MGMFDTINITEQSEVFIKAVKNTEFENIDFLNIHFQTKDLDCNLDTYILENNTLLKEEYIMEEVPLGERPYAHHENPALAMMGSMRKKHLRWSKEKFHGIINIYDTIDVDDKEIIFNLQLKFNDGELVKAKII